MIKDELINMNRVLQETKAINNANIKFKYTMAKNSKLIKDECDALEESKISSPDYIKYDLERININKKYSLKDKDDKPIITNNQFTINKEKFSQYTKEIIELQEKYKKTISDEMKKREEFNKLLLEPVSEDIINKLHKIEFKDIPESLSQKQIEDILYIIKDK